MVTERIPNTKLYDQLVEQENNTEQGEAKHIQLIGDAESPGLIADAVFLGHLAAQSFEAVSYTHLTLPTTPYV